MPLAEAALVVTPALPPLLPAQPPLLLLPGLLLAQGLRGGRRARRHLPALPQRAVGELQGAVDHLGARAARQLQRGAAPHAHPLR